MSDDKKKVEQKVDKNKEKQSINLVIRQREKLLFQGEVKAFSSINEKGVFDVIYKHANFISLINKNYMIHNFDGTKNEVRIEEGIVEVHNNNVTVFLGILG